MQADYQRVTDERSALLTKVKALEKDWQSREASIAEEKAALKKQVQDGIARLGAMQQDYEKLKALHADLAGETGRKAEEWTAREQRLTSEKNQLKVDLERVQGQLSDMMSETNELQGQHMAEARILGQRMVERHDRAARVPEEEIDPFFEQGPAENLGAGELLSHQTPHR